VVEWGQDGERNMDDRQVRIGDLVRAETEGQRARIGWVVGESHAGACWVLQTVKGRQSWNKRHCEVIRQSEATRDIRRLKPDGEIYGDGEI
jgi:hypothetical protein